MCQSVNLTWKIVVQKPDYAFVVGTKECAVIISYLL